jgi:Type III restriction enzyme, res subunit
MTASFEGAWDATDNAKLCRHSLLRNSSIRRVMVLAFLSRSGVRPVTAFTLRRSTLLELVGIRRVHSSAKWLEAAKGLCLYAPTPNIARRSLSVSHTSCVEEEDKEDFAIREEVYVDGDHLHLDNKKQIPAEAFSRTAFEVTAPFAPQGDQAAAIQQLLTQLEEQDRFSVLHGITGTGKTLVMSHVIANYGRPALVLCHNKVGNASFCTILRVLLTNFSNWSL